MATMIPDVPVASIEHESEREVYAALRDQLDRSFLVFHSYPWLRLWRGDREALSEGEADFVVAHPDRGLLVLEVKGGDVGERRGEWFRETKNGPKPIKNPFNQARRNMHALNSIVDESEEGEPGGVRSGRDYVHGYAVVFPHLHYRGRLPAYADRAIIISQPQLSAMRDAIVHAFDRWTDTPRPMDHRTWNRLRDALMPRFAFFRPLGPDVDVALAQIQRLTEHQSFIYQQLLTHRARSLVTGPAGCGKTLLAMEQALARAERGARTLFVCYNKELACWLREQLELDPRGAKLGEGLVVLHFHDLARELAERAGIPFKPLAEYTDRFWKDEAPDILEQALAVIEESPLFDVVIVDEAQDFREEWWYAITDLIDDSGILQVFMDPNQSLWGRASVPEIGLPEPMPLTINCRNTKRVADASARILDLHTETFRDAPEGIPPKIVRASRQAQQRGLVETEVRDLLSQLDPSRVALLGPARKDRGSLKDVRDIDGVPLVTSAAAWRAGEGLLVTTARSFKGLEADAIVVYDLGGLGRLFSAEDLYVASTRAKYKLVYVVHGELLRGQLRGWCAP